MKKSVLAATAKRLQETPEGSALLGLIEKYQTPTGFAAVADVNPQRVRQWIYDGRISKQAAVQMARAVGMTKEQIRPDIPADKWPKREPDPKPERNPVARNEDAKLLVRLSEKYGSVRALCDAAFCTPGDYHTWKTRGRIPAIKLPTLLALQK